MAISREARRRIARLQAQVDKVTAADAAFFERRPHRRHRVRLASVAELGQGAALCGVSSAEAAAGGRWIVIVRQLAPGIRFRAFAQALDVDDLDVTEDEARAAYDAVVRPGTPQHRVEGQTLAAMKAAGVLR